MVNRRDAGKERCTINDEPKERMYVVQETRFIFLVAWAAWLRKREL